ncbi:Cof-type HAD-IIB family hydrolase [Paenibacillus sp. FJAT-26967]|uniref:Cof-type HAD-IIB family hydrolase n=1 Tax=Paenibacillus sp. FJAT-26967 TaxID=1729690 RepID=UPI0008389A16|nr:Cof-type HAD-IIB family hydrolase [Paenibacillus sp. FJAT-26967]
MTSYKLVALDLDGTTLTEDKRISDETRYWIKRAMEAGVTVIFSTGRGMQTASMYWDDLRLEVPMVMLNGAEIWKGPGQLWERHYLSRQEIRKLHNLAVDAGAWFWGYSVESLTGAGEWTEEMFERDWLKFGIRHDDLSTIAKLREDAAAFGNLEITRSADINMEVTRQGVSKEYGVRKVCELLGIGMHEVMAIGDHHNDMLMIQAAGWGVAMGNAEEELKRAADAVTDTNEQDGVARAIQRYVFGLEPQTLTPDKTGTYQRGDARSIT